MRAEGAPVEHVGSILMPVDEVVFSLIAARDEALVRELNERAGLPVDRITVAISLSSRPEPHRRSHAMTRFRAVASRAAAGFAVVALAVAGCTGGASPAASGPLVVTATPLPAASAAATPVPSDTTASDSPSESALPSAVATNIDPCQLFTSADASSWVGVNFGAGKEATSENNIRSCTYARAGHEPLLRGRRHRPGRRHGEGRRSGRGGRPPVASEPARERSAIEKFPNFADNTDAAILQGSMSAARSEVRGAGDATSSAARPSSRSAISRSTTATPPTEQAFKDKATELLAKLP